MIDLPNIAFISKAGAGKDTAGALLIEHLNYRRLSFADKLREVAVSLWGERARNDRYLLQSLGLGVRQIEPDTWVNNAVAQLHDSPEGTKRVLEVGDGAQWHPVIVTDLRFTNEAFALTGEGFKTVRIEADRDIRIARLTANGKLGPEGWEEHESETALDGWRADHTITNNGSVDEFWTQVLDVIDFERRAVEV